MPVTSVVIWSLIWPADLGHPQTIFWVLHHKARSPPNPGPTEQESLLLRIFRSLHEDQRGMALAYSQWLAERFK